MYHSFTAAAAAIAANVAAAAAQTALAQTLHDSFFPHKLTSDPLLFLEPAQAIQIRGMAAPEQVVQDPVFLEPTQPRNELCLTAFLLLKELDHRLLLQRRIDVSPRYVLAEHLAVDDSHNFACYRKLTIPFPEQGTDYSPVGSSADDPCRGICRYRSV